MNELIELWIKVTKERELEELPKEMNDLYDYTVKLQQERDKYKKVIEEVRKYIESKNNGVCIINGEEKGAYTFLLDFDKARKFVWELLQILDKGELDYE